MDLASLEAQLKQLSDNSTATQQQKHAGYGEILQRLVQSPNADIALWKALADSLLSQSVTAVSREVLTDFINSLSNLPVAEMKEISHYVLEKIQPRVMSFEEQATNLRIRLADVYEREGLWTESAKILSDIPFDSGHNRATSMEQRFEAYVRIAGLYMMDGNLASTEEYLGRASSVMSEVSRAAEAEHPGEFRVESPAELKYKELHAEVMDRRCRFLEAAQRYYNLSFSTQEERRALFLERAVTCAILASAGPQRSRMLATLYKDDRTHKLPVFGVLKKMYLERIIHPEELDQLGALASHQMAQKSTDATMLEHAVLEHSILAVSRLYKNISFAELGSLLHTPPARAEKMAAQMVVEGRMRASIDQIEGVIRFEAGNPAESWDASIRDTCTQINRILDQVAAAEPAWMATHVPNNA